MKGNTKKRREPGKAFYQVGRPPKIAQPPTRGTIMVMITDPYLKKISLVGNVIDIVHDMNRNKSGRVREVRNLQNKLLDSIETYFPSFLSELGIDIADPSLINNLENLFVNIIRRLAQDRGLVWVERGELPGFNHEGISKMLVINDAAQIDSTFTHLMSIKSQDTMNGDRAFFTALIEEPPTPDHEAVKAYLKPGNVSNLYEGAIPHRLPNSNIIFNLDLPVDGRQIQITTYRDTSPEKKLKLVIGAEILVKSSSAREMTDEAMGLYEADPDPSNLDIIFKACSKKLVGDKFYLADLEKYCIYGELYPPVAAITGDRLMRANFLLFLIQKLIDGKTPKIYVPDIREEAGVKIPGYWMIPGSFSTVKELGDFLSSNMEAHGQINWASAVREGYEQATQDARGAHMVFNNQGRTLITTDPRGPVLANVYAHIPGTATTPRAQKLIQEYADAGLPAHSQFGAQGDFQKDANPYLGAPRPFGTFQFGEGSHYDASPFPHGGGF